MTPDMREARQGNGGPREDDLGESFSVSEAEPVAKGGALTVHVTPSHRDVARMPVFAAYDENEVDPYVVEVLTLLVTASERLHVVAGVVAAVGDDAALVLALVRFRTMDGSLKCYEQDGYRWWRATAEEVAADSGLSYDTAKRVRRSLIVKGFLVGIEHGLEGPNDRTISVRLALQPLENTEGANLHDRGGKSARSRGGKSAPSSSSEETKNVVTPRARRPKTNGPGWRTGDPLPAGSDRRLSDALESLDLLGLYYSAEVAYLRSLPSWREVHDRIAKWAGLQAAKENGGGLEEPRIRAMVEASGATWVDRDEWAELLGEECRHGILTVTGDCVRCGVHVKGARR